jgi:hypothetical protein
VAQGLSQEGLADANLAGDENMLIAFQEVQPEQLLDQLAVILDVGGVVPLLEIFSPMERANALIAKLPNAIAPMAIP